MRKFNDKSERSIIITQYLSLKVSTTKIHAYVTVHLVHLVHTVHQDRTLPCSDVEMACWYSHPQVQPDEKTKEMPTVL